MIFTKKNKELRSSSNLGYKIQKICGWKIYSRTPTFGAEVHKSNVRVKRWHNFCLNDMLTKSNHTEIQTYKVEERTSGIPCVLSSNLAAVT